MTDSLSAPDRLLVLGDDGSPDADVAWLWVCNHAWPEWRADVITAVDPPFPPASWEHHPELVEWDSPHPRLLVAQSQLRDVRLLTIQQDRRIALDARTDADLVVVGPGRLEHARSFVLGSTTDWLLHYPSAPLAIVRSATPTRHVLVCVDGSNHAQSAVETFAGLPWAADTEVVVLGIDDGRSAPDRGIHTALATLQAAGVQATSTLAKGKPTQQILRHIESHDAQLVVLGTRGLTGWKRLRLGSTASHVVRAAPCNCLVACVDDEPRSSDPQPV